MVNAKYVLVQLPQVRYAEGPCSELPRPVSPAEKHREDEEPASHEDMQKGPRVDCVEEKKKKKAQV